MVDNLTTTLALGSLLLTAVSLTDWRGLTLRLRLWKTCGVTIRHLLNIYHYEIVYRSVPYDCRHCWSEQRGKLIVVNTSQASPEFVQHALEVIFLTHCYRGH